ncbi:hypothetical protein LOTGIDRAFT_218243 [Lottia gigantea]|uniref:Kelch domain-containing protein 2 n=1 Tax=Lottia gigantea TaxID=225164 RepID=V3ZG22_LOTGI|nr:hypothetical protein LOTGIDRAFT_218243 [Lottia gigantea]ESO90158.1 hypothetical protein LOTGIDRAFT_218243 [Lottia gigantea]
MHYPRIPERCGHISQCIGMNVLVCGGYQVNDSYYLSPCDIWVYNLELETWKLHKSRGEVPNGMSGSCSCVYDEFLYVIAGHSYEGNVNTVHKLNLKTLTWSKLTVLGEALSPRDKATCWCYDNKIYVFGGFGVPLNHYIHDHGNFEFDPTLQMRDRGSLHNRGWNNQVVVFDIKDETWSNPKCKGVLPQPRAAHATARIGDNVYLFGGRYLYDRLNDLHCLNLKTLTWSGELNISSNIPVGRSWHTLTSVSEKLLFLYGGYTQNQVPLSDAWVLDVISLQWTQLNVPINRPRLWHSACVSQEEDIVIFGGCASNILDQRQMTAHTNDIICFRVSPKSLQRLCFEAVFSMKDKTQSSWEFLPYNIRNMLNDKLNISQMNNLNRKKRVRTTSSSSAISRNTTCTIS